MELDPESLGESFDDMDDTTKAAAGLAVLGALDQERKPAPRRPFTPQERRGCWILTIVLLLCSLLLAYVW